MEKSIFDEAWAYAEEFVNPYQHVWNEKAIRMPRREKQPKIYFSDDVFDSFQWSEELLEKRSQKILPLLSNVEEAALLPADMLPEESGFLAKPA